MAISDSSKIDFLWKKVTYGVTKSDSSSAKSGSNETIASPLPVYANQIWASAASIPGTPPSSTSGVVQVYSGASRIAGVADTTSTQNVTWKTNLTDWIPATFGANYTIKVYVGDPQTTGVQIFPDTNGTEFVFDYNAGVLNFPNGLPANISNGIYFVGYRYVGAKGVAGGGISSKVLIVSNIAARDALTGLSSGDQVYVTDASGDTQNVIGSGEWAMYLYNGSTFSMTGRFDSAESNSNTSSLEVTPESTGSVFISRASSGVRVISVSVDVTSAFDGTMALTVGSQSTPDLLMSDYQNDLQTIGNYVANPSATLPTGVETALYVTFSGSSTVGDAIVTITYA